MLELLTFIVTIVLVQSQEWVVNTEYGAVRGHWSSQDRVWRFDGMPYAASPLGSLRFKAPVPPTPWNGVLDAINDTVTCYQAIRFTVPTESEDCLVINVYAPESARTQGSMPVLFFIHGGAFTFGSGNGYEPYWTTRHDVILITFNYRVGPFGYTCLGTERAPGNAGFKDIIFALRWTNRNIHSFGGDPGAITLYGESASGYQAHALVLTEIAEGLFQRAIIESGAAMNHFGHNYNRLGMAKAVANDLGFLPVDDLDRLGEFLENASAGDLIQSTTTHVISNLCIERQIDGVENAVPERYDIVIGSGNYKKVPLMFAFAEIESMLFQSNFFNTIDDINNNFESYLPVDLVFPTPAEKDEAIRRIKELYFGGGPVTANTTRSYFDFVSDQQFFIGIYRSAVAHSLSSDIPVYLMEFSYRGGFNQPSSFPEIPVASHADIVAHVLHLGNSNNATLAQDQVVRDRMTEMWANFVKYGNPTPEGSSLGVQWPAFTAADQGYLNVGKQLTVRRGPSPARTQLWTELYDRYFYPPPAFENSGINVCHSFVLVFSVVTLLFLVDVVMYKKYLLN